MANPVVYNFPTSSANCIVSAVRLQNGERKFIFNGSLSLGLDYGSPIVLTGINRRINLQSAANLSTVNFTITGKYNNVEITQTITGPNNSIVYFPSYYNTISSITVDRDMPGTVNIGTGSVGVTNWFVYDHYKPYSNLAIACFVNPNMNFTFRSTYDDVIGVKMADETGLYIDNPIANLAARTTSITERTIFPFRFCRIEVNNSSGTGSGIFTLMQQGH